MPGYELLTQLNSATLLSSARRVSSLVVKPVAVRVAYSRMAKRASAAEAKVLTPSIGTDLV